MNRGLIALGTLLAGLFAGYGPSYAQAPVLPYYQVPKAGTSPGNQPVDTNHPLPVTAGTITAPSAVEITDGVNGPAAVKPASTAPLATDPALVVVVSPNSASAVKSGAYVSAGTGQFALAISTNTQLTVPTGTTCVETASIRRTSDGTSATTTNGTLIQVGAQWQDCGPLAAYKFTAVSGSPTLDVEYFK